MTLNPQEDPYWKLHAPPATPAADVCACEQLHPVLLRGGYPNPLACGACNGEVPPERLRFDAMLADRIAAWRDFHGAFFTLWLDSGEHEQFAAAELARPDSAVNRRGLELAGQLSIYRPCYMWWFTDDEQMQRARRDCPRCTRPLIARFVGERPSRRSLLTCDACLIAIAV